MQLTKEFSKELHSIIHSKEPKPGELRFEQAGAGLMFKILNEKEVYLSAVFNSTLIADLEIKDIDLRKDNTIFYTKNGSAFYDKGANELMNAPINHINDRECELLLATIDDSREDNLIIHAEEGRQLKSDYKSANGGWILQYAYNQRAISFGEGLVFIFDAVDVNKKYVKLYDSQNSDTRIYLSRSKVAPF